MAAFVYANDEGVMKIVMDSEADLQSIREDAQPGSTAHVAGLTAMYEKAPSGEWVQIGGADDSD